MQRFVGAGSVALGASDEELSKTARFMSARTRSISASPPKTARARSNPPFIESGGVSKRQLSNWVSSAALALICSLIR